MGDRRPNQRSPKPPTTPRDVFAECGLVAAEFEVESGGGQSFLNKERLVGMTVTHRPSGRKVSGKIGTTKRGSGRQADVLLRSLLRSFR